MTIEQLRALPGIEDLMAAKQAEMEAALTANRRVIPHEGEKGAASELRWRSMLETYLPRRYAVTSGFVVDHRDGVSEQIDIIIHDVQYSPLLFQAGATSFVPAESIYAVFDVKQVINRRTLRDTGAKVASVRQLSRTSGTIYHNKGSDPGKDPNEQPILGGILALEALWKEPFGPRFTSALSALADNERLDLGVALAHGAFEVTDGTGGQITYGQGTALVGFFVALIRKLQPLATALAMDLDIWSRTLRQDAKR